MAHSILLVPESMVGVELLDRLCSAEPGDVILVPDGFHFIELDPERMTVKERGFQFELTPEGLKRLE